MNKDMRPSLPRAFLWTDKRLIDDFFQLDSINEDFYEVLLQLRSERFVTNIDALKVFNEVYYQLTRMIYDSSMPGDLYNYINDVKANLGWNYSAELVMSMAYFLLALIDKQERPLNRFFTKEMNERFGGCIYWKPFKHKFEELKKKGRHVSYIFRPQPWAPAEVQKVYVAWHEITRHYELSTVDHVINLWLTPDDRRQVARMIAQSFETSKWLELKDDKDIKQLRRYLRSIIDDDELPFSATPELTVFNQKNPLMAKLFIAQSEVKALKCRIEWLESENKKLSTLLDEKKQTGSSRRFTLVQIVDYCKSCVEWNDVKHIVAMLNKLLRRVATEDDSNLVDSIETHFKDRRYGSTYNAPVGQVLEHVDNVNKL